MSYTVEDFVELFGISRQYYYELQAKGDGPLISWAGPGKPRIKLKDALAWAEQRIDRVALKHRARYEAGILHIKADAVIIANTAAKMDAEERAKQKEARLAEYEEDLAAYESFKKRNPTSIKKPPPHPFEKHSERAASSKDSSDWLPVLPLPSAR